MDRVSATVMYVGWIQAGVATAGSLFFSEVMALPPCVLCWYQRIAMYPLVVVFAIGILRREAAANLYALPLVVIGLVIAVYHNLLYYNVIPDSLAPCTSGVSCTSQQVVWGEFVTIPLLSLLSFVVLLACVLLGLQRRNLQNV